MKISRIFLTLGILMAVVLSGIAQNAEAWVRIENRHFSFSLPASFKKTDATGVDSYVEEYVSAGIELMFDFGAYSNKFGDWPEDTKYELLSVDGRPARIGTRQERSSKADRFVTQIHFPDGHLSMHVRCGSEVEVALARRIFQSITFNAKNAQSGSRG